MNNCFKFTDKINFADDTGLKNKMFSKWNRPGQSTTNLDTPRMGSVDPQNITTCAHRKLSRKIFWQLNNVPTNLIEQPHKIERKPVS